ncbi:hypothetical protein NDU88_002037 [Pleurodeles waltl]|uniref:Uncharacterized protein n=1 Tax=Pleurodeles waltl TaxID=8319 RepID=A0AAV7W195_PLEWA|nr:hypothetical protein NDU88_002037 [Pleurodeles waltl]
MRSATKRTENKVSPEGLRGDHRNANEDRPGPRLPGAAFKVLTPISRGYQNPTHTGWKSGGELMRRTGSAPFDTRK